jgi:hypothetical protein
MFATAYQKGFLSILYSVGAKPLQIWSSEARNGHVERVVDQEVGSSVIEIVSANSSSTLSLFRFVRALFLSLSLSLVLPGFLDSRKGASARLCLSFSGPHALTPSTLNPLPEKNRALPSRRRPPPKNAQ